MNEIQHDIINAIFVLLIQGKGGFHNLSKNEVEIIDLLKLLKEDFNENTV